MIFYAPISSCQMARSMKCGSQAVLAPSSEMLIRMESIIGYYDLPDGRRHGFVGRPKTQPNGKGFGNIFSMHLSTGLNMLSVPLKPTVHMTARSLALKTGATTVITIDAENQQYVAWTPNAPDDGFPIEGAKGYIVNLPTARAIVFTGTGWTESDAGARSTARDNTLSDVGVRCEWTFRRYPAVQRLSCHSPKPPDKYRHENSGA